MRATPAALATVVGRFEQPNAALSNVQRVRFKDVVQIDDRITRPDAEMQSENETYVRRKVLSGSEAIGDERNIDQSTNYRSLKRKSTKTKFK